MFCAVAGPDMVNDMVHVNKSGELCNACPVDQRGELNDLTIQVGVIYCQVLGAMAVMAAAAVYFEGSPMRTFVTMLPFIGVMAKHIAVDGLIPPVPVMILGAVTLALGAFVAFGNDGKGTDYGKYAFLVQFAINLAVFVAQPAMVVEETWPGIDATSLAVGMIFVGVIQYYCAMMIVLFAMDAPMSHFIAQTLGTPHRL